METTIIRDNRETYAATNQQRLLVLEKRFMFQMLAFLLLWRFEVCQPRQLLMLLLSLFQFFFLHSNPLTEHCAFAMYHKRHF